MSDGPMTAGCCSVIIDAWVVQEHYGEEGAEVQGKVFRFNSKSKHIVNTSCQNEFSPSDGYAQPLR